MSLLFESLIRYLMWLFLLLSRFRNLWFFLQLPMWRGSIVKIRNSYLHLVHLPIREILCSLISNWCSFAISKRILHIFDDSKLSILSQDSHRICSWWWLSWMSSKNSSFFPIFTLRMIPILRKRLSVRNTLALPIFVKFSTISWAEKICLVSRKEKISFLSSVTLFPDFFRMSSIFIIETWYQIYSDYRKILFLSK